MDTFFLWIDGDGARASYILTNPNRQKTVLPYRLEFECTNNVPEYEPLVQGLLKAISLDVKYIEVFGDS